MSNKNINAEAKRLMGMLLINTVMSLFLYFYISEKLHFNYILFIYLGIGLVLGVGYLIYNRGFVGKDATPDMLPDTMTVDEKQHFLEDCKARLRNSRWVLVFLIPILVTVMADVIYLFYLQELFS